MPPQNKTSEAMLLMLASMMCLALMGIVISWLSSRIQSGQMVLVRNALSLVIVMAIACRQQKGLPRFPTKRIVGHFGRAAAGLIAMQLWFHSLTIMPVTLVTALSFTTPIFSTIIAIVWLKEQAGWRRWTAMAVSFIGVILILRPDTGSVDAKVLFVLGASATMAVAGVFVKNLSRTEPPETIVFYMALFMTPLSVPLGVWQWKPLTLEEWGALLVIGLLSTTAQLMMPRAYKRAAMVTLMPLDFSRLIFTSIFAYICFGEVLDSHAWLGAAVIVASTLYIAQREARMGRIAAKIKNITM